MREPGTFRKSWTLPSSNVFDIRQTADSGRAVFAQQDLHVGSHVLTTTSSQSPLAHVILRPYRREVCAWCFAYDRGREWKLRDVSTNHAYCKSTCQDSWKEWHGDMLINALTQVEAFIRSSAKRRDQNDSGTNSAPATNEAQVISTENAWIIAEQEGAAIKAARSSEKPTKSQRAAIRKAVELSPDPDILSYLVSGIIAAYKSALLHDHDEVTNVAPPASQCLPSLFELVPWEQVFSSNPMTDSPLKDYTSAYLVCLALLPTVLLDYVSVELVINLASRAAHNAFSIRPEGTTDGEQSGEFLGWGVWPEASFFNHSCRPNLSKSRTGRFWSFAVDVSETKTVRIGDELCITYLGGDEKDLDVYERRKRLSEQWGFTCLCLRCEEESTNNDSGR